MKQLCLVMKGPEAKLWEKLKLKLPQVFWTRIENTASTGIPDVYGAHENKCFFIELKITKSNAVRLSPTQISWNFSNVSNGGRSFFLVEALSTSSLYLFSGKKGRELQKEGLKSGPLATFPAPLDANQLLHSLKTAPL